MHNDKLIYELTDSVKAVANDVKFVKAIGQELEDTKNQLGILAKDVAQYRKLAENMYGRSGSTDYRREFAKWLKASFHQQKGLPVPPYLKAAADYVGDTDAQGGHFVPEQFLPTINALTEVHGKLWPHVTKVQVPPGQDVKIPYDSTLPTMTWRSAQGGAGTEDAGPIAFGADTLNSKWLHDYVKFSNELLASSNIAVADAFAVRMVSKGIRAVEYGILQGDDSGGAYPHDGIFVATGVNDQTDLATPTFANVANFIGAAIESHEGAADESENYLILTPGAAMALATEAVGSSELTGMLTWGDPRAGVPSTLAGYTLVRHPGAYETNHRIAMAPLGKIHVGWSGNWKVDFNPFSGWSSNETWMMVSTHADYVLGNTDMYSKADVTALS